MAEKTVSMMRAMLPEEEREELERIIMRALDSFWGDINLGKLDKVLRNLVAAAYQAGAYTILSAVRVLGGRDRSMVVAEVAYDVGKRWIERKAKGGDHEGKP